MRAAAQQVIRQNEIANSFTHKEYDMTNYCLYMCVPFGAPYSSTLSLEPEFVVIEDVNICGANRRRVAYGETSVDRVSVCCFVAINNMFPKCGCDVSMVNDIAFELQQRVGARGITGQLQKTEQIMQFLLDLQQQVDEMDKKLDVLIKR
jgi:hypothetical protein